MLDVYYSKNYKKSFKRLIKSGGFDVHAADIPVDLLMSGKDLPKKYFDHELSGRLKGYRECHLKFDLVVIYKIVDDRLLMMIDIGSHSQLFNR